MKYIRTVCLWVCFALGIGCPAPPKPGEDTTVHHHEEVEDGEAVIHAIEQGESGPMITFSFAVDGYERAPLLITGISWQDLVDLPQDLGPQQGAIYRFRSIQIILQVGSTTPQKDGDPIWVFLAPPEDALAPPVALSVTDAMGNAQVITLYDHDYPNRISFSWLEEGSDQPPMDVPYLAIEEIASTPEEWTPLEGDSFSLRLIRKWEQRGEEPPYPVGLKQWSYVAEPSEGTKEIGTE